MVTLPPKHMIDLYKALGLRELMGLLQWPEPEKIGGAYAFWVPETCATNPQEAAMLIKKLGFDIGHDPGCGYDDPLKPKHYWVWITKL